MSCVLSKAKSAFGFASSASQPSETQQSTGESSTSAEAARSGPLRWPADWAGEPFGAVRPAEQRFPCIGAECAAIDMWHEKGAPCRAYRDAERYLGRACGWQRMCSGCSDSGACIWRPDPAVVAAMAAQRAQRQASQVPSEYGSAAFTAEEEAAIDAAIAAYYACEDVVDSDDEEPPPLPPPPPPPPPPTIQNRAVAPPATIPHAQQLDAQRPPPPPPLSTAPPQSPPPLISHNDERRKLGKPLWTELAPRIPRPQHDGSWALPTKAAVDPEALRREFSTLPFVERPAAETRATAVLAAAGAELTAEKKEEVSDAPPHARALSSIACSGVAVSVRARAVSRASPLTSCSLPSALPPALATSAHPQQRNSRHLVYDSLSLCLNAQPTDLSDAASHPPIPHTHFSPLAL